MNKKRIGKHLLFWVGFILWAGGINHWTFLLGEDSSTYSESIFYTIWRLFPIILSTYILIYLILPRYLIRKKQYPQFFVFFMANFLLASLADRTLIASSCSKVFFDWEAFIRPVPIIRNGLILLSVMGLASLIKFFKLYIDKEKKEHHLKQLHLQTKLSFLKAQVSPHFLFNALNNIYSMAVLKDQKKIASSIENLSGIMQYLTYDSNSKLVPLEKEICLLQNYIEIQHLRIADTDDTTISFNIEGNLNDKMIAPAVLLPLVENAFKHGISPTEKCLVNIKLFIKENVVNFKIKNTFFEKCKNEISEKGIGLDNITRRLKLIYPKKHYFKTSQTQQYFFSELQLDLNS